MIIGAIFIIIYFVMIVYVYAFNGHDEMATLIMEIN